MDQSSRPRPRPRPALGPIRTSGTPGSSQQAQRPFGSDSQAAYQPEVSQPNGVSKPIPRPIGGGAGPNFAPRGAARPIRAPSGQGPGPASSEGPFARSLQSSAPSAQANGMATSDPQQIGLNGAHPMGMSVPPSLAQPRASLGRGPGGPDQSRQAPNIRQSERPNSATGAHRGPPTQAAPLQAAARPLQQQNGGPPMPAAGQVSRPGPPRGLRPSMGLSTQAAPPRAPFGQPGGGAAPMRGPPPPILTSSGTAGPLTPNAHSPMQPRLFSPNAQPPRSMRPGPPTFQPPPTTGYRGNEPSQQSHGAPSVGLNTQRSFGRTAGAPRIDPEMMPRPPQWRHEPEEWSTRMNGKNAIPLPAAVPQIIHDNGNASPRVMRATLNIVPASSELLSSSSMPFAVLIQPLAPPQSGEEPIQVVDMGSMGPLRCARCKAYVNPFFRWTNYGRTFVCNLCGLENPVPPEYQEAVGGDGRRRDADERPELCRGSVEFIAPPDMQVRAPMPPVHFFLVDVSHTAVTTGVTTAACNAIQNVLGEIQGKARAQIGIATFDTSIQFYSLSKAQGQPRMMVVPDAEDPYCPSSRDLFASADTMQKPLEALLDQIPRIFAGTQVVNSCATAAIEASIQALQENTGGKLHVFLSSLPKVGTKALNVRDQTGQMTGSQPLTAMNPATKEYRELAELAANNMISVDLFCMTHQYVDVATLAIVSELTSGQLYTYQPFNMITHGDEFLNDLKWNIVRPQGWEAVGRVRVSEGLVIERYYGPHYRRTLTDLDFPAINADSSLAVELRHKDRFADNQEAYIQFALVFTDSQGNRQVRVHTIGLKVSMVMGTVFKGADLDAQMNFNARTLAYEIPGGKLDILKRQVTESAVNILLAYRQKCAHASATGQLILPESLKLLPLYTMALLKTPAMRRDTSLDERAAWLQRLKALPAERTLALLYPRLYALGDLLRNMQNGELAAKLPSPISYLSASKLADDGVFLLENSYEAYVYFGDRVAPELMMALVGAPSLQAMSSNSFQLVALQEYDTQPSRTLHGLVDQVRRQHQRFLPVQVVPHMPPNRSPFFRSLVEDALDDQSYVDFLCDVHKAIQRRL